MKKKLLFNCSRCKIQKCNDCISKWGYCGNTKNHCNGGINCKKC